MAGKVIGKTLPFGFRGNPAASRDTIIEAFRNVGQVNIQFGAPVVFDATNKGVRALKSTDSDATAIIGIAVRHAGQPYEDSNAGYYYKPNDTVDVLVLGQITVELKATTGIAARGQVYADPSDGELTSVSTNNLAIPNAVFVNGDFDGDKITEIAILKRSI